MRFRLLLACLGLGAAFLPAAAAPRAAALPGSYAELADLRAASREKPWRTFQASGYDRGGGFYDSGNFLREEPGRRFVMLDTEGPGVLDRMWFTRKSVREPWELQLFLDGAAQPSVRIDLDELCSGRVEPFVAPFTGSVDLARYCYVPIGFRTRCKAVLVPTAPPDRYSYRENSAGVKIPHVYYQLTYRRLPAGAPVEPFTAVLSSSEKDARESLAALWGAPGLVPPAPASLREITIEPRGRADLFQLAGAGVVSTLLVRLPPGVSAHDLRLDIHADGEAAPAVSTPLALFCAAADPRVPARGLWAGCADGLLYSRLPMPYRKGLKGLLVSGADRPVTLAAGVVATAAPPAKDDLYLHARRYDYQPPLGAQDYSVLDVHGRGHWVGLVMDRPGNMEGDDRFYVDGEAQPSIHGTGTEDFFSFAWGFGHLADQPLHGITRQFGAPLLYRFHLPAAVPFSRGLRLTWEHGSGNEHQGRYSGTAFYYSDRPGTD